MRHLEIGQKLYKYTFPNGIFEYEVIGIRENREGKSYEIRCEHCNHGFKCEVLVAYDERDNLKYLTMLNDDDNDQYHWHITDKDNYYHETREKCLVESYKRAIKMNQDKAKKLRADEEHLRERIKEQEGALKDLLETIEEVKQ